MGMQCTRCEGTGFLNLHQIPDKEIVDEGGVQTFLLQCLILAIRFLFMKPQEWSTWLKLMK